MVLFFLQDAKKFCRDIMAGVRQLREKRDMSINEVKLTVAIEDPTDRERKAYLGVEVRPALFSPLPHVLMSKLFSRCCVNRVAPIHQMELAQPMSMEICLAADITSEESQVLLASPSHCWNVTSNLGVADAPVLFFDCLTAC